MTNIIPLRRRSDTNPEITYRDAVYTTRLLDDAPVVLRRGRGNLWHMCAGHEAARILAGLSVPAMKEATT